MGCQTTVWHWAHSTCSLEYTCALLERRRRQLLPKGIAAANACLVFISVTPATLSETIIISSLQRRHTLFYHCDTRASDSIRNGDCIIAAQTLTFPARCAAAASLPEIRFHFNRLNVV
jgi:hypothetical protein